MANGSKRMRAIKDKIDPNRNYPVADALQLVKETATAKFDESIDIAVNLGVDACKSDQMVRGAVVLPKGIGKAVRVAVFAQGENVQKAIDAGADIVGFDDLAADIKAGKMDFDVVIATPDAMRVVGQLGQVLLNLLQNALQAMPNGGELTVSTRRRHKRGQAWIEIVIEDTGAGIAPENLENLFVPSQQLANGISGKNPMIHQAAGFSWQNIFLLSRMKYRDRLGGPDQAVRGLVFGKNKADQRGKEPEIGKNNTQARGNMGNKVFQHALHHRVKPAGERSFFQADNAPGQASDCRSVFAGHGGMTAWSSRVST